MSTKVHWDPFKRATNGSTAWRGNRLFGPFDRDIDNMFEGFLGTPMWGAALAPRNESTQQSTTRETANFRPPIDVIDDGEHLRMVLEIPGVDSDNVDVTVEERRVVVRGEKPAPERADDTLHYSERRWGPFERIVKLAADVDPDGATATFENGVLSIELPKQTPAPKGRKIEVKTG